MAMDFMPPVVVRLVADIKDFQSKVAAAEAQMGAASTGMGRSFNMVGAAAGIAGLAVAGFAAKLAIDGVQAAVEDEKAAAKLAQTMQNLGLAHDVAPVEAMIDSMQREYGVADDELRPAMDRLLRSTHDTGEAQKALKLAMDIAAGTGKDLSTVTAALGRAYDGSTTSLARLGAGIDQSVLKGKNMDEIMGKLSATFKGQATVAAQTYEGQMKRLQVGFDELKESIGYGFLNALGDTKNGTDELMQAFQDLQPLMTYFGRQLGENFRGLGALVTALSKTVDAVDKLGKQIGLGNDLLSRFFSTMTRSPLGFLAEGVDALTTQLNTGTDAWGEYWAAASGTGYRPSAAPPTPSKPDMPEGRDWQWFYGVNPSAQEALAKGRVEGRDLYDKYLEGLKQGAGGGGGGAAKVKEALIPIGVTIVDGLIEGINISTKKLPDAAQRQLDTLVQAYNTAVQESRTYMAQVSKSLVDSLDFQAAADAAEKAGTSIVDAFVEQSKKVAAFGANMIKLAQAGLNDVSWNQIYDMGAVNGAKIADALISGNMAENIARTNEAVGSVLDVGEQVAVAAMKQYKQTGIDTAMNYLTEFIKTIMPDSKEYKKLMKALDELAAASNRTSIHKIVTVHEDRYSVSESAFAAAVAALPPGIGTPGLIPEGYDFPLLAPGFTLPGITDLNLSGILGFAEGGWVPKTGPAIVHQKEFVLSRDMLEGKQAIPESVRSAVGGRGASITVNANTNADPVAISREIAWNLRVGVI